MPEEPNKKKASSHEVLNSIVATAGLLLAVLSLGIQLNDRLKEDVESVEVQPTGGVDEVSVGIVNTSRKEIWLRAIRINFIDERGNTLRDGGIQVKPPPEGAIRLAPKQVEVFVAALDESQVPDEALCANIVVVTSLGFLTDYYVNADLYRSPSRWRNILCPQEAQSARN